MMLCIAENNGRLRAVASLLVLHLAVSFHGLSPLLGSCHAMPCCDISSRVMFCRVMSCPVMLCLMLCQVLTRQSFMSGNIPHFVSLVSYFMHHVWPVLSSNLVLCVVPVYLSCHVLLSLLLSCHVTSCNDLLCQVLLCIVSLAVSLALATRFVFDQPL